MLQAHWRGRSARLLLKQDRSAQVVPPSGQFQPATTRLPVPLSASSAIVQRWVIRTSLGCLHSVHCRQSTSEVCQAEVRTILQYIHRQLVVSWKRMAGLACLALVGGRLVHVSATTEVNCSFQSACPGCKGQWPAVQCMYTM